MINPHTGREFTKEFFRKYAKGKPCKIRIARSLGYPGCASDETTVLCHITLPGLKAMGKKLIPDLLGAWGCDTCHGLVDGRYKPKGQVEYINIQIQYWHYQGMIRTIDQLIKDGVLPNP